MRKNWLLPVCLYLLTVLNSCNNEVAYIKTPFEGKWVEQDCIGELLGGTDYKFTFTSNKFILNKASYSDAPFSHWNIYYCGTFTFNSDTLFLTGLQTDSRCNTLRNARGEIGKRFKRIYKYQLVSGSLKLYPKDEKMNELSTLTQEEAKLHEEFFTIYFIKE